MVPWIGQQSLIVAFPGHTHFLNSLILFYSEKSINEYFAYSEDPDEMQHNAAFHQVLHCLQMLKRFSGKGIQFF